MPETQWEKIVAWSMLCAIIALSALILLIDRDSGTDGRANGESRTSFSVEAGPVTQPAATSLGSQPKAAAKPAAPKSPAKAQRPKTRLVLTATGDTWLEVRAGTVQGKLYYFGILPQGESIRVAGRLWVRFGWASNVAARLNGKPFTLPPGTYNALIAADGLRQVPE